MTGLNKSVPRRHRTGKDVMVLEMASTEREWSGVFSAPPHCRTSQWSGLKHQNIVLVNLRASLNETKG